MNKLYLPDLTETEAVSFLFYQIPQALVDDEAFSDLDGWAIILYSLMLNRAGLSVKNSENFKDENGRLYIIFTVEEVMKRCRCGKNVAIKIMQQLEDIGLIEKKRQGLGKPSLIYVKNFSCYKSETTQMFKKQTSGVYNSNQRGLKNKPSKVYNINHSNINLKNHNNLSKINSINPARTRADKIDSNAIKDEVKNRICLEALQRKYYDRQKELQEIYEIIVEVLVSKKESFRIAKEDMPAATVKQAFAVLDDEHIKYAMECLRKTTTQVTSIKSYLQTTLWNATKTINNHYVLESQKDIYENLGIQL